MTQTIETKFNFKARKIVEDGKEVGKTKKQPPVVVALPVPTAEEVQEILQRPEDDKVRSMILDSIVDVIRSQAKAQFDDLIDSFGADETKTVSASDLDFDKLTLEYIANLEPGQRGVRAIPDEDWEAMYADYLQVMVTTTGKPESKIKNHLELFKKPTKVKQNKDALAVLVDQLDIYISSSANIEETGECAQRLRSKFDKWLHEDDKFDASAL